MGRSGAAFSPGHRVAGQTALAVDKSQIPLLEPVTENWFTRRNFKFCEHFGGACRGVKVFEHLGPQTRRIRFINFERIDNHWAVEQGALAHNASTYNSIHNFHSFVNRN
jgi:hypothetical protein